MRKAEFASPLIQMNLWLLADMYIGALNEGSTVEFSYKADINMDLIQKICGCDIAQKNDNWTLTQVKYEQIRRHKKKRINKKWAKKYGYRQIYSSLGNFNLSKQDDDFVLSKTSLT